MLILLNTMARLATVVFLTVLGSSQALNNGLALTPPMGFLSWERFRCNTNCTFDPDNCVSEKLYMQMADILVQEGYKDVGYEYVSIDDCWLSKTRDADGNLQPDPDRFPHGILALSRYMHSKGLKLGIYEDVGTMTCAHFPGSEGHIEQDAQQFAKWELDLLKFDGCNTDTERSAKNFPLMSKNLNRTGRPIMFTCEWWDGNPSKQSHYTRNAEYCNTWRTHIDIQDNWDCIINITDFYAADVGNFSAVSGPGQINDADQLLVGDYSLSYDQEKAQFGMWAMFSSTLYISADLRTITPEAKAILQNKGVIAINQDPLVKGGTFLKKIDKVQVWLKPLVVSGSYAVAFFNPNSRPAPTQLFLTLVNITLTNPNGYNVTDVFDDYNMGVFKPSSTFKVKINPNGIVLVKAVPQM